MRSLPFPLLVCIALATVSVGTAARGAEPDYPLAVAVAPGGEVYLGDRYLPGVWMLADGKLALRFAGSKRFRTPLNALRCVALDGQGRLLVGDSATREVYRFDDEGRPQPLTAGFIGIPMDLAVNSQGEILVSDLESHRIYAVNPEAAGAEPREVAEAPAPSGLAIDGEDRLWIVSRGKDALLRMTPDGKLETVVAGRAFEFPNDVALGPDGTAYVTDGYAKAVWKVPAEGAPTKLVAGAPLQGPVGIDFADGKLWVADPQAKRLFTIDPAAEKPAAVAVEMQVAAE